MFIVIDGMDGSGKTTQTKIISEWLEGRGFQVVKCNDPGTTMEGAAIRKILLDVGYAPALRTELLLFLASRAQLVSEIIRPALDAKKIVVCDRFVHSTLAYQGHAGGIAPAKVYDLNTFATGGLIPDLTFVLDVPVSVAMKRRKGLADRIESKGRDYFQKVRNGYLVEARSPVGIVHTVNANVPLDDVTEQIKKVIGLYV